MPAYLTDAQLQAEFAKCEFCEEKPCRDACPVDCSPADFIMAAREMRPRDIERSAAIILGHNPLGGFCGAVCPDTHCMAACVHKTFNNAVNIPAVQATIVQKAKSLKRLPVFDKNQSNQHKVAVVGGGPAGLGAAAVLAQLGYEVHIFENAPRLGGMVNLIPDVRLDNAVLNSDIEWFLSLGHIEIHLNQAVHNLKEMATQYSACIVASGLDKPLTLHVPGAEKAEDWIRFLKSGAAHVKDSHVAVIGGGAVALDCAIHAKTAGARDVELICLENVAEMPLTEHERTLLLKYGIAVTHRTRLMAIEDNKIRLCRVRLADGESFHPSVMKDVTGSRHYMHGFDHVIMAIGASKSVSQVSSKNIFLAGDALNGPTTVVEAVASGKNAAEKVHALLQSGTLPVFENETKSCTRISGRNLLPVSLESRFFDRPIKSPFILSAAPPSDGYEQLKQAYEAGWAGGVMKTAFDGLEIHIPSEYMFRIDHSTYGNCDNVSGHSLDRVCAEAARLVKEFPDRLTLISTGGPVTGNDASDKLVWQSNTKKCEASGAMGVEYSLSCPQGGDGTKGDIVSQDAELTAKVVEWIMEVSRPDIPKLFKLTGAVTAIYPILHAIKSVLDRYPNKKAGVTLANTFPALAFRDHEHQGQWRQGVVVGLSGKGVLNISNLTLANASRIDITISGNGGPMNYLDAAGFLALGAETVQFCTVAMKYGLKIIDELESGLSFLLKDMGLKSVSQLIGCALPEPVTGFMDLTAVKKISDVNEDLCQHCGNCQRCSYMAITLNESKIPVTDPEKCVGCSICAAKCFSGALFMRDRSAQEAALLKED